MYRRKRSGIALIISLIFHLALSFYIVEVVREQIRDNEDRPISIEFVEAPKVELKRRISELPNEVISKKTPSVRAIQKTDSVKFNRQTIDNIREVTVENPVVDRREIDLNLSSNEFVPKITTAVQLRHRGEISPTIAISAEIGDPNENILSSRIRSDGNGKHGFENTLGDFGTAPPRAITIDGDGDDVPKDAFGIGDYIEKNRDGKPQKVAYVLDISSSMTRQNKLNLAINALKDSLSLLHEADAFSMILFDAEIRTYTNKMLKADQKNLDLAKRFLDGVKNGSGTNLSGGLERALKMEISTMVVISDGDPSRGLEDPDQIRAMVRRENRSNAKIMTIALGNDHTENGVKLLKRLADEHSGEMVLIKLR